MARDFLCRIHPDFHMPAEVEIGAGFDGDAYVRRLKQSGADAVAMFAKCHYGHAYYPSKFGTVHPRLGQDMMDAVGAACRNHDLGFVAYYSVFLDTCAAREHPDWALQARKEGIDAGFASRKFLPVCVSSPYLDQLLLCQCREVVAKYGPDEILLDTMSGFNPCYCSHCRASFGRAVPEDPEDPSWLDYVRWYAAQYDGFFARTARELTKLDSNLRVTFNWEWSFRRPASPPASIGNLTGDLIATGRVASIFCRYAAGTGLPFAYMTGRFMHGLGDWTSNTPVSLTHTAAATIAHGGDFWIIDRQLPDGSLEDRAYQAMEEVFSFMDQRREWLVGARHVPETAALFACEHVIGPDLRYFADMDQRKKRIEPFQGLNQLCMLNGRHYTAVNSDTLLKRLDEYRLVILPEVEHLAADLVSALGQWVSAGGRLLMTQPADRRRLAPGLEELAGVEVEGFTEADYGYFDTANPLRIGSPPALVALGQGAEPICNLIEPLGSAGQFGHGCAPPGADTGRAAIVSRRQGSGEVIYVAASGFGEYFRHFNPLLGSLLRAQWDRLLPDPIARVETDAPVELVLLRKGDDLIIHLVNHSAREHLAGHWYPVFTHMPEIRNIRCIIRWPGGPAKVVHVPSGQFARVEINGDLAMVTIPSLGFLSSLSVLDYFSGS